jgi:hypothetical protein
LRAGVSPSVSALVAKPRRERAGRRSDDLQGRGRTETSGFGWVAAHAVADHHPEDDERRTRTYWTQGVAETIVSRGGSAVMTPKCNRRGRGQARKLLGSARLNEQWTRRDHLF